jgi:hypothetical protein
MLLNREKIRQDKYFDMLTEAILERDQPRTTDLFFGVVAREGRSVGDALSVVTAAEAPFVQVPSHINIRDGQITLINNDHTILGPAGVSLSDALSAGKISAAAAAAERLVHPRRARDLEPAARQVSWPLRDNEGD